MSWVQGRCGDSDLTVVRSGSWGFGSGRLRRMGLAVPRGASDLNQVNDDQPSRDNQITPSSYGRRYGRLIGRKTENTVPDLPGKTLVFILMWPPYLRIMSLLTHSPRPVPFSGFVVKNASNIRDRLSGEIPLPLSAIVTLMPFSSPFSQFLLS